MDSSLSAPFCQKLLWKMDKLHKNYFLSVFFVRRLKMWHGEGGFVREGKGRQAAVIKWVWKGASKKKQLWPKIQTAVLPIFTRVTDTNTRVQTILLLPADMFIPLWFSLGAVSPFVPGTAEVKGGWMWIALIAVFEFCVWCSSEIPALLLSHSPLPETFHLVQLVL